MHIKNSNIVYKIQFKKKLKFISKAKVFFTFVKKKKILFFSGCKQVQYKTNGKIAEKCEENAAEVKRVGGRCYSEEEKLCKV